MLEMTIGFALAGLIIMLNGGGRGSSNRENDDHENTIIVKIPLNQSRNL